MTEDPIQTSSHSEILKGFLIQPKLFLVFTSHWKTFILIANLVPCCRVLISQTEWAKASRYQVIRACDSDQLKELLLIGSICEGQKIGNFLSGDWQLLNNPSRVKQ